MPCFARLSLVSCPKGPLHVWGVPGFRGCLLGRCTCQTLLLLARLLKSCRGLQSGHSLAVLCGLFSWVFKGFCVRLHCSVTCGVLTGHATVIGSHTEQMLWGLLPCYTPLTFNSKCLLWMRLPQNLPVPTARCDPFLGQNMPPTRSGTTLGTQQLAAINCRLHCPGFPPQCSC